MFLINCPAIILVRRQSLLEEVPEETELALVLHDAWNPTIHQKAEENTGTQGSHGFEVSFRLERESLVHSPRYTGMFILR